MAELILDGALLADREALHDRLAEALSLPVYYGRNLDALYDVLTERGETLHIRVLSPELLPDAVRVLGVLRDAAEANPHITLEEIS